eukprot:15467797-Alexandrium_andersonii.AAC.1
MAAGLDSVKATDIASARPVEDSLVEELCLIAQGGLRERWPPVMAGVQPATARSPPAQHRAMCQPR